jgi:hypothetical protein
MKLACIGAPQSTSAMQLVAIDHLCLRAGQVAFRRSQFSCVQEQLVPIVMAATRLQCQPSLLSNGWRSCRDLRLAVLHTTAYSGDVGRMSERTASQNH